MEQKEPLLHIDHDDGYEPEAPQTAYQPITEPEQERLLPMRSPNLLQTVQEPQPHTPKAGDQDWGMYTDTDFSFEPSGADHEGAPEKQEVVWGLYLCLIRRGLQTGTTQTVPTQTCFSKLASGAVHHEVAFIARDITTENSDRYCAALFSLEVTDLTSQVPNAVLKRAITRIDTWNQLFHTKDGKLLGRWLPHIFGISQPSELDSLTKDIVRTPHPRRLMNIVENATRRARREYMELAAELGRTYDLWDLNCQNFAKLIFTHLRSETQASNPNADSTTHVPRSSRDVADSLSNTWDSCRYFLVAFLFIFIAIFFVALAAGPPAASLERDLRPGEFLGDCIVISVAGFENNEDGCIRTADVQTARHKLFSFSRNCSLLAVSVPQHGSTPQQIFTPDILGGCQYLSSEEKHACGFVENKTYPCLISSNSSLRAKREIRMIGLKASLSLSWQMSKGSIWALLSLAMIPTVLTLSLVAAGIAVCRNSCTCSPIEYLRSNNFFVLAGLIFGLLTLGFLLCVIFICIHRHQWALWAGMAVFVFIALFVSSIPLILLFVRRHATKYQLI